MRRCIQLMAAILAFTAWTAADASAGAVMQINNGTAYLFSNEVHPVTSPTVSITENGNGNPALMNPLLLIVGVPNSTSFAAPGLTLSAGTADLGGSSGNAFGGHYNATTGLANGGLFNSGEVYSFLGLTGGDNSNSFGNWAGWDSTVNGITASGFGVFVYELTGTGMTGGRSITATFNSPLPVGTFVVAYGQDGTGSAYSTAFTNTGLSTGGGFSGQTAANPEPASLILLGTGLVIGAHRYRRRVRQQPATSTKS